jgi:hypothetical protein
MVPPVRFAVRPTEIDDRGRLTRGVSERYARQDRRASPGSPSGARLSWGICVIFCRVNPAHIAWRSPLGTGLTSSLGEASGEGSDRVLERVGGAALEERDRQVEGRLEVGDLAGREQDRHPSLDAGDKRARNT